MKMSLKAILLSALVYPGAGHFILKKYLTCITLVTVFSVPLFGVINDTLVKANQVVEQVVSGKIPADIASISQALTSLDANAEASNIKMYVMIIVWVIGVLDAYRVSKQKR